MENLRYLPKSLLFVIPSIELELFAQFYLQLAEKITFDFWKLAFWLEALLKSSKVAKIVS